MRYYDIAIADSGYRGDKSLTYSYNGDDALSKGVVVSVPLRSKKVLGIVANNTSKPTSISPKHILRVHTSTPLPEWYMPFASWMSTYYPSAIGQVLALLTPSNLKQYDPSKTQNTYVVDRLPDEIAPRLTPAQNAAWQEIRLSRNTSVLLRGITGSGKTRVYLETALESLKQNKSVFILTPEIGLTPQLEQTLHSHFGNRVIVIHSNIKPTQKRAMWLRCLESTKPLIVIGPRSALFTPLRNIGAIIIDEAHDSSYRQDQSPHYNAVRAAGALRSITSSSLILGTATPNVVDYYTFAEKKLPIISLDQTAIEQEHQLQWNTVSTQDRSLFSRSPWLSDKVINAIEKTLSKDEQSMVYLNRRGTARYTVCDDCDWKATCPSCDSPLVYHADTHLLHCHHCETTTSIIAVCPICKSNNISLQSIGTKMIESELLRLFPQAKIARFDKDTESSRSLSMMYRTLQSGSIDIIIGTQMVSKGLDLPYLSFVAMLQGDSALNIPDYSAEEELYQQINQLKGRVGRGHREGLFILQARQPEHSMISAAIHSEYLAFYEHTLAQRKTFGLPPFSHLLKITASRKSQKAASAALEKLRKELQANAPKGTTILGPAPAAKERFKNSYQWNLLIKSQQRSYLISVCKGLRTGFKHDIDPDRFF